jgi:ComF family protein
MLRDWFIGRSGSVAMLKFNSVVPWIQSMSPCLICGNRCRSPVFDRFGKRKNPPYICGICFFDFERLPLGTDVTQTQAMEQLMCPQVDGLAIVGLYETPINGWITKLKFYQQYHFALTLGFLLAKQLEQQQWHNIDYICALPLHPFRKMARGYNQAQLLMDGVLSFSHPAWPIFLGLTRQKHTKPQTELNQIERKENTRNAFVCVQPILDKNVLLIDDVITTGSSINSATVALKNAGAKHVYVACAALRILS